VEERAHPVDEVTRLTRARQVDLDKNLRAGLNAYGQKGKTLYKVYSRPCAPTRPHPASSPEAIE
jgi:hypothetical protein